MRVLSKSDVSSLLQELDSDNARRLLRVLSEGLAAYSKEQSGNSTEEPIIHQPQRFAIRTRDQNTTLIMPCSDTTTTGVKVITVPRQGSILGAISLYNAVGELQGLVNAEEVTGFRTALATMTLLERWPAPAKARLIAFGAGKQVEWHVRLALIIVPGIERVTILNRSRKRLEDVENGWLAEIKEKYHTVAFETVAQEDNADYEATMNAKLIEADIIFGCTPSTEPLFRASHLQAGEQKPRFLSLIGSYKPEMQEVDGETLKLAGKIWVDSKEECLMEAGELIRAGYKPEELTEIGELFLSDPNSETKLESASGLLLFKCVGFGLMDLKVGQAILDLAADQGRGTVLDF